MIFGDAGDPELFMGHVYREDGKGLLVQKGNSLAYLRWDFAITSDDPLGSVGTWNTWRKEFQHPEMTGREELRLLHGAAAGIPTRALYGTWLTIKEDGVVVLAGDGTYQVNTKVKGEGIPFPSRGTITVEAT